MYKILTILMLFISTAIFGQVKDTLQVGEYAISTLGTNDYVNKIDVPTIITSKYGVLKADTVFYIPSTAPNDTIATLMTAANNRGRAAILFQRGSSRNTTTTISQDSLIFGSYGSGVNPKIYGSEIITGWTLHSGNIYKATFATDITQLFVDGVKMQVARLTNTGYNTISSVTSQTVLVTNIASQASNYYVGAKVFTRTQNWLSDMRTVTASTGSTITIDSAPENTLAINQGLVFTNKLEFLDAAGEWYSDGTTVYVWTPTGASPSTMEVRGSTLDNGIVANGKSYINIQNLEILQQNNAGIDLRGTTSNVSISNCTIKDQDNYGIYTNAVATLHNYSNNTISGITNYGIYGNGVSNCIVSNNVITNINLFSYWGLNGGKVITANNGSAIEFSASAGGMAANTIEYNTIQNIGYNGLFWRGVANIRYNYIYGTQLTKSDGGGIYTGSPTVSGSTVSYNIIDYVLGNQSGWTSGRNLGEGIYLDENSNNVIVEYNSINNCSNAGLNLHKPSNHTVRYNTVLDARYNVRAYNTATGTAIVLNNIFITGKATDDYETRQLLQKYTTTGVTFNNNQYINGFASDAVYQQSAGYLDFAAWKTGTSQDAASTYLGTDLATNETQRLVYNASKTAKTFYLNAATSVTDENGTTVTGSFVLQPFTSKYVRGFNIDCILDYSDAVAPTVTAFVIPATATALTIDITTFTTSSDATKYLVNESATTPLLTDANWSTTIPTTYTFATDGTKTLYAWCRDAAGNISTSLNDGIVLTVGFDLLANVVSWHEGNSASGATVTDSKGGSSGTLAGGYTTGQTGEQGLAVDFDGTNGYMSIPLNAIFNTNMTNSFSVLCRFKNPTTKASGRIFEASVATTDFVTIGANNGILSGTVAYNNGRQGKEMTTTLNTSTWYTVVVTFDTSTKERKFYVNGTEITNAAASPQGTNGTSTLAYIAKWYGAPTYTDVLWETLGIFNKVLTADEISWLQDKEYADL